MDERALYLQTKQIQLDAYETKLGELKKKASEPDANTLSELTELTQQIKTAELKLKDAKTKLEIAAKATNEEIESHKKAIDDTFREIYSRLAMS